MGRTLPTGPRVFSLHTTKTINEPANGQGQSAQPKKSARSTELEARGCSARTACGGPRSGSRGAGDRCGPALGNVPSGPRRTTALELSCRRLDRSGWTAIGLTKSSIRAGPQFFVTGNLYVPDGPDRSRPALSVCMGTGARAACGSVQARGHSLARTVTSA